MPGPEHRPSSRPHVVLTPHDQIACAASPAAPSIFCAAADNPTQVQADETVLGRHMDGIRDYNSWDSIIFGANQIWMRDTGHTIFMSNKAQRSNGTAVKFADIAAAGWGG